MTSLAFDVNKDAIKITEGVKREGKR